MAPIREEAPLTDWYSLADLGCAAASGALIWLLPKTGPWALGLAFLPWLVRLGRKLIPFQRTALDIPITIFLVTAGVGAWASYNGEAAFAKLWLILAGVLLFYAIAGQPAQNLWWVYALLSATAAGIALYFLFTYDWYSMPADLGFIQRLGATWAAVRPRLPGPSPHPNIAGGLIAWMTPYMLALLWEARQRRQRGPLIFTLVSGGIAALGLLMSSSRAAWLSLGAGMGFWLLWWLSGHLAGGERARHLRVFTAGAALLLGLGLLVLVRYPGGPIALFERLPGPDTTGSRLEIARGTMQLVRDFPFTGGGLHAFAGLYSHYIVGMPFFLFNYAHNLYLDLALEQGVAGLLAYLLILAGATWYLLRDLLRGKPHEASLASLASLVVLALHGMADDPLYAGRGTPFLLLVPAMAVAVSRQPDKTGHSRRNANMYLGFAGATVLLAANLAFAFRQPLLSSWYTNLGAVHMARVELADFPRGEPDDGSRADELAPAEDYLTRALALDPSNATAHYRLGLISLLRRDFPAAQASLEQSLVADPQQRGARKYLAFAYLWNGDYERAERLMTGGAGVRRELEAYVKWWRRQDRPDLAERAEQMLARLP